MKKPQMYELLAEFEGPEELLAAAHRVHDAGYTLLDAFTPFPVEGLAEAIGFRKTRLPLVPGIRRWWNGLSCTFAASN